MAHEKTLSLLTLCTLPKRNAKIRPSPSLESTLQALLLWATLALAYE